MSRPSPLSHWTQEVSNRFSHLSRPYAVGLALWSFGIVGAESCGITSVAGFLAEHLGHKESTLRQRLREWTYNAVHKKGVQRTELVVDRCFAPLLDWVLDLWREPDHRLALALDATTLGQRFVVLAVSVLYRGCAIPVAWAILPTTKKEAWRPHWERLLRRLADRVPADWTVIVLADRGLYAKWLFHRIQRAGWHPLLRINVQGQFRLLHSQRWRPLRDLCQQKGQAWVGRVVCFKTTEAQLRCTVVMRWEEGHDEAWVLVTDLAPQVASAVWYGLRMWIERGFKLTKRGGWQWHQTKMQDPARAERVWLAIAVATLWTVSVGSAAEDTLPPAQVSSLPPTHVARQRARRASRPRRVSCFGRGLVVLHAWQYRRRRLPVAWLRPEPWPTAVPLPTVALSWATSPTPPPTVTSLPVVIWEAAA